MAEETKKKAASKKATKKKVTKKAAAKKTAAKKAPAKKAATKKAATKKAATRKTAAKKATAKKKAPRARTERSSGLRVTLVRSPNATPQRHRLWVRSLGLKRMNQSVVVEDTPSNRGLIQRAGYLLRVEELA